MRRKNLTCDASVLGKVIMTVKAPDGGTASVVQLAEQLKPVESLKEQYVYINCKSIKNFMQEHNGA